MSDGGPIGYDTLIVATGAHHTFFGHDDWARYAQGLKTLEDAIEVRRRILIAFEAAEREADPERRGEWLTFVLVGGGPTGVELAGSLGRSPRTRSSATFARSILGRPHHPGRSDGPRPADVPAWPIRIGQAPARAPRRRCPPGHDRHPHRRAIRPRPTHCGQGRPRGDDPHANGPVGAGVIASSFARKVAEAAGAETDRAGRVIVEPDLTVPGHPEIFVVGDAAVQPWKEDRATRRRPGRHPGRLVRGQGDPSTDPRAPVGALSV